jgi:hypothetical protein
VKLEAESRVRPSRGQQALDLHAKTHEAECIGEVVRLFPDEGYGFIRRTDGDEL